jgi:hypothetical protein
MTQWGTFLTSRKLQAAEELLTDFSEKTLSLNLSGHA